MGGPEKAREVSEKNVCLQECKTSLSMVKQRGQSDTGKVKIGVQSMKFGIFF